MYARGAPCNYIIPTGNRRGHGSKTNLHITQIQQHHIQQEEIIQYTIGIRNI